jgi:putative transposase
MARLARLEVPGLPHLLLQRGHNGESVVRDEDDAKALHAALLQASRDQSVAVHAYGIWPQGFLLMLTPSKPRALGLMMQSVGRRYAAHFNRRHGRSGGVWDGRFRATVIDAQAHGLDAQQLVESRAGALAVMDLRAGVAGAGGRAVAGTVGWIAASVQGAGLLAGSSAATAAGAPASATGIEPVGSAEPSWSSLSHHLGQRRDALIQDAPAYWALGNTPFERESAWRSRLHLGLTAPLARRLADAVDKGWALGSAAFADDIARLTHRRTTPLPRGRPRKRGGVADGRPVAPAAPAAPPTDLPPIDGSQP